jgi:hypothetical protein
VSSFGFGYDTSDPRDNYTDEEWDQIVDMFDEPGGNSALRRATPDNPRNLPCPECEQPNLLTPEDVRQGYICNQCADRAEKGF